MDQTSTTSNGATLTATSATAATAVNRPQVYVCGNFLVVARAELSRITGICFMTNGSFFGRKRDVTMNCTPEEQRLIALYEARVNANVPTATPPLFNAEYVLYKEYIPMIRKPSSLLPRATRSSSTTSWLPTLLKICDAAVTVLGYVLLVLLLGMLFNLIAHTLQSVACSLLNRCDTQIPPWTVALAATVIVLFKKTPA